MPPTPTSTLASFAATLRLEDVPAPVRDLASNLLLDTLASALAGRHGDETSQVETMARALGGGSSTVIGAAPSSLIGATLVNGYQVTAVTVCDIHKSMLNHVTPGVVPAALAIAERDARSGRELLEAIIVGVETTTRVGLGLRYPDYRARGWHSPGVLGPFGGAAAVGRLLGLDELAMRNALGLAGSQSAGTFAAWGTPAVKFHQTRGGAGGLMAGLLAAEGFRAAPEVLAAADGGLFTTYGAGGDADAVVDGLGETWTLPQLSLRRWPAAGQLQGLIIALTRLIDDHDLVPERIAGVQVGLSETVVTAFGGFGWEDKFRARLSPRYVSSVVLHDRRCWLEQFLPDRLTDPSVDAFARDRVRVVTDPSLPETGTSVVVTLTDGAVVRHRLDVPRGDAEDPMSRDQVVEKFHDARAGLLDDGRAARVLELLDDLDGLGDVGELTALLGAPADTGSA